MELVVYVTVAVTLGLVVVRPRVTRTLRLTPALAACAGVVVLLLLGAIGRADVVQAGHDLWAPFVTIAAVMVMTSVAERIGLLDFWAARIEKRARSVEQLFALAFAVGVLTSAALNNDAAILSLTPTVLALVRRIHPGRRNLLVPFAFAVFMSAGVAALPMSNPMNVVVANIAGINFVTYVAHMIPVAVACWIVSFLALRAVFARELGQSTHVNDSRQARPATRPQRQMMLLLGLVLLAYPIMASFRGPVWAVASGGAIVALVLAHRKSGASPARIVVRSVSWDTLAFLLAVLLLALALRNVGLVHRLRVLYAGGDLFIVGLTSALGSAILNNHPMSYLNVLTLGDAQANELSVLAALVGGDLGPRLLPTGSLAGLLWLEILRREGIQIGVVMFARVGTMVTVPSLFIALWVLALY